MIKFTQYHDNWQDVKRGARTTVNMEGEGKYPDNAWKKVMLLSEHSPIRQINFGWRWEGLKSWISVHFVRHNNGILHFVSTQREDRTGEDRNEKPQGAPVNHECVANAQALINISRKRLCGQAHPETRAAWLEVKNEVQKADPILASVMVPECIYRGFCPEKKCCGYYGTNAYWKALENYREKAVK